jgi:hypothetical protein
MPVSAEHMTAKISRSRLMRPFATERGHSFHRYRHIEAVFVFGDLPDHWSALSSGQAISVCPRSRRAIRRRISFY